MYYVFELSRAATAIGFRFILCTSQNSTGGGGCYLSQQFNVYLSFRIFKFTRFEN